MNLNLKLVTGKEAFNVKAYILGTPTTDRILVAVPKSPNNTTSSGLIIPETAKEDMPKKATIILVGEMETTSRGLADILQTGNIVTYGLYAGKEVYPQLDKNLCSPEKQKYIYDNYTFRVISSNEIIFVEPSVMENL